MPIKGFQIDVSVSDLNDVNTTGSPPIAAGDVLVWNDISGMWEHQPHTLPASAALHPDGYYLDVTTDIGSPVGILDNVLPVGWTSLYNSIGKFTITHGLNTTSPGFSLNVLHIPGSPIVGTKALNPTTITANSITFQITDASGIPIEGNVVGMLLF